MIRPHDLRLRLIATFGVLVIFTSINRVLPAATGVVAVLALYAVYRQSIPWRRLLHLEGFLVLLLLTLPFTLPGTPLLQIGPLTASNEGLWRAVVLACKVTASVLLISFFFATTDPLNLGTALRSLYIPEQLIRLLVTVVRHLSLIQEEFLRLHDSMRARGFAPRSNRHTWRSYGYMFGMLLVRTMNRAERVEEAMRLRGYTGHFPRTNLQAASLSEWGAVAGFLGSAIFLLLWDKL